MKSFSRREFAKLSLAAISTAAIAPTFGADKVDSKVRGVQIGLNVPYSFGDNSMSADEVLQKCVALNISGVELRTQPVEVFLGAPKDALFPEKGTPRPQLAENAKKMTEWRKSAPVKRLGEFRKKWNDAGVLIEIVKVDGIFKMSDEELDYVFPLAKALGARALSTEISNKEDELKRVGGFADKHEMMIGYHGHATTTPEHWEKAFALAKHNGANVDIGHFVAGNNISPAEFLKKHHDRVTHIHVKDRKMHDGANTVFGEGETPIVEILQLIRDNKWPIQATIEFEYKVPAGSDRMKEIARSIEYCRKALAA